MNRQQRRAQGKIQNIPVEQIVMPHQMTIEACVAVAQMRISDNISQTGHPLHHKTANGAIVTPDPTLEYVVNRLKSDRKYADAIHHLNALAQDCDEEPSLPPAIPVNRKYYGFDPYAKA